MLEQRVCELDSIDRLVWKASDQMKGGRGRKKQVGIQRAGGSTGLFSLRRGRNTMSGERLDFIGKF